MATVSPIQLQKHLKGMDYPAGKDELVSHAQSHGAPDEVLQALQNIPDRQYDGPNGVSSAVGDQA